MNIIMWNRTKDKGKDDLSTLHKYAIEDVLEVYRTFSPSALTLKDR